MKRFTTESTCTSRASQVPAPAPIVGLILTTCVLFLTLPWMAAAQTVHISDPNLRAVLKSALGKEASANITQEDMASLEVLDAFKSSIHNITGLEYAINLTELHLGRNRISDVSPLKNLTNLEILDLHINGKISDVSPLKNLTNLQWLSLRGTKYRIYLRSKI